MCFQLIGEVLWSYPRQLQEQLSAFFNVFVGVTVVIAFLKINISTRVTGRVGIGWVGTVTGH